MRFEFFLYDIDCGNRIYRCEYIGYMMEVSVPADIAKDKTRLGEIFLHTVNKNISIGMPES